MILELGEEGLRVLHAGHHRLLAVEELQQDLGLQEIQRVHVVGAATQNQKVASNKRDVGDVRLKLTVRTRVCAQSEAPTSSAIKTVSD